MAADLVSKTEYKNYLGITSGNKDQEISFLIPKVSSLVKTYCRRSFIDYYDEAKTEIFDGGFPELILKETPVINIEEVSISTNYGQTYTELTKYTDWVDDGDKIRSTSLATFPKYIKGYRVIYTAGFETVPDDLKLAVLDLIEYYSKNNSAVHVNRDIAPNITQIQYVASTNFPAHIKRILDQYVVDCT